MAAHTVAAALFYDGVWNNLTVGTELSETVGIKTSRGSDEYGVLKPSKIEWTFEDRADKFRPSNPVSPLYGKVGRATPTRVIIDGSTRVVGEAASYKPGQTLDFSVTPARGRRYVAYRAEGVLRRIGLWTTPLRSAMFRHISRTYAANLVGYWSGEESRDATQLSNYLPGGDPGRAIGVSFADGERPAGGDTSTKIDTNGVGSRISGRFKPGPTTGGWQISWSCKLGALPAAGVRQMMSWTTTNGYAWAVNLDAGVFILQVNDRTGATLSTTTVGTGTGADPNQWITYRVKVSASAGTVTAEFGWYPQGGVYLYGISPTFAGTTGALASWSANGNTAMVDARMAHVFGVKGVSDNLQSSAALQSFDGYVGELASVRYQRLCGQESIPAFQIGSHADTQPMGRQAPATFLELLKEIQATDDCLIYDAHNQMGLVLRTRRNLYNQAAKITLSWPLQLAPTLEEELDDVGAMNLVTVKQRDGGEAVAEQATGPMSTLPPPNGIGEYKGGPPVDVSVYDETSLADLAGWWLSKGTIPGSRYPQVTVDLDGYPGLATAVHSVNLGDRIVITGRLPDPIGLIVVGIDEVTNSHRRLVTFKCVSDAVLSNLGIYDTSRYDSASTTLVGAETTTDVTWAITTADRGDVWGGSWDGTPMPYPIIAAGERCSVTACTAPAGTGPYTQTMTVVRSVNGVIKAQLANEPVHIADPARYGL